METGDAESRSGLTKREKVLFALVWFGFVWFGLLVGSSVCWLVGCLVSFCLFYFFLWLGCFVTEFVAILLFFCW